MTVRSSRVATGPERRHPAAVVDDVVAAVVSRVLGLLGWWPDVVVYPGYGAAPGVAGCHGDAGWVRVLARVLMTHREGGRSLSEHARGWRHFVTAHVAGADVVVRVGGSEHRVRSDRGGVVDVVLPVALEPGRHPVTLRARRRGRRGDAGEPLSVSGRGATSGEIVVHGGDTRDGLVSDVDDTVMVTRLPRPLVAGWNTFVLRETARRAVPGIAELYRQIAEDRPGLAVFYLSTGAWDAAPVLARFLRRHGYPDGPLLLTNWGPTNTGWFRSGREHKQEGLRRLAAEFPHLTWILVGDDGQHDPTIYSEFARSHPRRVAAVALRELTPAEQVLSRGIGVPAERPDGGDLVVTGADGHALADRLVRAGVLGPRLDEGVDDRATDAAADEPGESGGSS